MILKDQIFKIKMQLKNISLFIAAHILGPFFWRIGIVFLTRWSGSVIRIGEMAHQFDFHVKMSVQGYAPRHRAIILAKKKEVANPCLLKYWQRYISVISHPILVQLLIPLVALTQYNTKSFGIHDDKLIMKRKQVSYAVQKQWEDEGRLPLLSISLSHHKRGWDCLEQLGIPRGAWFVCLHVRESGFLNEKNDPYHNYRNADVDTYLLAVKTIVERGGWVIRMGDPTTKPLPLMDHVIDYAHSDIRSDWMDIFCCAECRFFLGTTSGLFIVSYDFGIPCALANFTPLGDRPWSKKDIFIPKLYWSTTEGRYLTFEEALAPDLRYCYDGNFFKSKGVDIVDNTPEEINEMVLEMLDRLNGVLKYSEEDELLHERFNELLPYKKYTIGSRIGRAFLHKYARFLPDIKRYL